MTLLVKFMLHKSLKNIQLRWKQSYPDIQNPEKRNPKTSNRSLCWDEVAQHAVANAEASATQLHACPRLNLLRECLVAEELK